LFGELSLTIILAMNVLVVGGAGYLGGALTDLLLESEFDFRVYDNLLYEEKFLKPVPFIKGDVRNKHLLAKNLKWADVVVWLAAIVGDKACLVDPETTNDVNFQSVKWLSKQFNKRIIFTSTCSVYGAKEGMVGEDEDPNPISIYAETKVIAEKYLSDRDNSIIFRLGTLFGLSDSYSRLRMDLVVNSLTAEALTKKSISVFGGKQFRPILHVKDAAQIIFDNIQTKHSGTYNLAKENITLDGLGLRIKKQIKGTKVKKQKLVNDFRTYQVDCDKAKEILHVKPKLSVEDGIREITQLFKEKRIKDFNNIRYYNHLYLENQKNNG
jgi:nucleoside-diphosphate-sugar epimerase